MKKLLLVGVVGISALLGGCSSIQTYEELNKGRGIMHTTNVGGQVFKIERTSDLPNVFGKADIYGGKINRGYTELRYGGKQDGKLIFQVSEIETNSNETTMSRYGVSTTYSNSNTIANAYGSADSFGNIQMNGYAQTTGTSTTYHPRKGSTHYLPQSSAVFAVDEQRAQNLNISGVIVSVISSDEVSVTYKLSQ